jgi:prephenate dehydratase
MTRKISIQGFEGSFHQIAALQFFGEDIEVIPCATFREVVHLAGSGKADAGLMAIETSIAGSILPNYTLLERSALHITGEIYLPIHQHLLVNRGVKLEDIREVHSHPMAIQQCMDFLLQYHWKLVETEDTALSARRVSESGAKDTAAIAGKLAADLFNLDIAGENIHTQQNNYTRFLVLSGQSETVANADKASVIFKTDHSKGSLARVLNRIAEGGINLSKLQSFPIPGSNWKYNFLADMEFDAPAQFEEVLKNLEPVTDRIRVYGVYKNGNKANEN